MRDNVESAFNLVIRKTRSDLFEKQKPLLDEANQALQAITEEGALDDVQRGLENIKICLSMASEDCSDQNVLDYYGCCFDLVEALQKTLDQFYIQTKIASLSLSSLQLRQELQILDDIEEEAQEAGDE